MDFDETKLDEIVLALLHLSSFPDHGQSRAWKSLDWDAMERLFERGLISDPKSKTKSVVMTEEGVALARAVFDKHFGTQAGDVG